MSQDSLISDLNDFQKQAVTYGNGPLLIVAGAGTGKTTVITRRAAWLIEQKLAKPDEILILTFTDKAAGELEERIDKLLPYGFVDLWVNTFHAFGEKILKQHYLDIGLPGDFKLLTQTDAWLLVRENLDKFNLDYYKPLGNPTKFIHALIKHFSRAKDELITSKDYLDYAEAQLLNKDISPEKNLDILDEEVKRLTEIAGAYQTYNQILLDNNALDFGDLINYTLKLFKTRPKILDLFRKQFKYILVDEFQDTNLAQYELIKLLATPENNLTVVGDDDQSIYKFRGASISNILHFKNDYPEAALLALTENYRSKQEILDKSYSSIINNNPDRLEARLNIDKKLKALKDGGIVEEIHALNGEDEAKKVIKKIIELYNESKTNNNESWSDFAILIRSHSEAEDFIGALENQGLPYQFMASTGLYRQEIILDILAYLKLLDNYHENNAVYRVLNMSLWGLNNNTIIKVIHEAKKKSLSIYEVLKTAAALGLDENEITIINAILDLITKHSKLASTETVDRIIFAFLEDSGYLKKLSSQNSEGDAETIRQISHLKEFFSTVTKFEQSHDEKLIKHYLAYLNYILESGEEGSLKQISEDSTEAIKIMTVHAAKGLEFKYVFVVNMVELKFPTQKRGESIELPKELIKEILSEGDIHLQEERRLFYVAMTRAKEGLFLSYADFYGNGVRKRKPSRFLQEINLGKIIETTKSETIEFYKPSQINKVNQLEPTSPKEFSFTQLKTFETCPYQYRFAHVLQIPTKGNATFSFGKTMHLTLQKFYEEVIKLNSVSQGELFEGSVIQKKNLPSLKELLEIYDNCWINEWYENKKQKEEYYEKGKKMLTSFYSTAQGVVPKYLEIGFHLKIGDYTLRGQIDRIDSNNDGTVELIDYKTGKPKSDEDLSLENKEQLLIYQLAAVESLKEIPTILSFYYLDNNKKISFIGTPAELQKVKDKIVKNIENIKKADFSAKPSEFNCRNCDFKDICEYAST